MLTAERHHIILEQLSEHGVVELQCLVQTTDSSESTIRRDLALLEEKGLLKRIHGGATLPYSKIDEPDMQDKSTKNLQDKKLIAEYAVGLIRDGDCIYLDAGSTLSEMLPYLKEKKVVVVTNGLMHIDSLIASKITSYLLGGRIKGNTKAIVGSVAQENLKQYRFDKCFLGMNGIDPQLGFTTPDPEEGALKRIAMDLAEEAFVLADKTKFNDTFFSKVGEVAEATIITANIDHKLQKAYQEKTKIKVVTT
ncbi:DeoR/GlpR family DNA-binding transcription regulator [Bacillus sp. 1P06AnD]|uniref:DeoR/GlpR family DNA-binding transcription regulator n=1 Tax=Bacillus sp. 1P06AnD TaxID=3132208 RepID=UPI0039A3A711